MIACSLLHQLALIEARFWPKRPRPGAHSTVKQWPSAAGFHVFFSGEWKPVKINIGRNYSVSELTNCLSRPPEKTSLHPKPLIASDQSFSQPNAPRNACELRRFLFYASEQTKRLYNTHGAKALNTPSWSTSVWKSTQNNSYVFHRWICLEPQIRVWPFS